MTTRKAVLCAVGVLLALGIAVETTTTADATTSDTTTTGTTGTSATTTGKMAKITCFSLHQRNQREVWW